MTLKGVYGFIWQYRTIEDVFLHDNPCKVMDEVWIEYDKATEFLGSGRELTKDYNIFMESKWAEVYRNVHGLVMQLSLYADEIGSQNHLTQKKESMGLNTPHQQFRLEARLK